MVNPADPATTNNPPRGMRNRETIASPMLTSGPASLIRAASSGKSVFPLRIRVRDGFANAFPNSHAVDNIVTIPRLQNWYSVIQPHRYAAYLWARSWRIVDPAGTDKDNNRGQFQFELVLEKECGCEPRSAQGN